MKNDQTQNCSNWVPHWKSKKELLKAIMTEIKSDKATTGKKATDK